MQLYPQKDLCVFGLHCHSPGSSQLLSTIWYNTLPLLLLKLKIFLCYCPSFSVLESCCRKNLNWLGKKKTMLYATEVLGNLSVTLYRIRETHLSNSISVSTNYFRIPVLNLAFRNKPTSHITRMTCCCSVEAKSVGVGGDVFSVTSSSKSDVDYLGESTKGDLNLKQEHLQAFGTY